MGEIRMDAKHFRYALTYWSHGSEFFDFGPDLEELVRCAMYAEERGEQAQGQAYEAVDGEWVEVPIDELRDRIWQDEFNAEARRVERDNKPFRVWIFGPEGISSLWTRCYTAAEAEAVASSLPTIFHPVVRKGNRRP